MAHYIWKDGQFHDRDGNPMPVPEPDGVCVPQVMPDIPGKNGRLTRQS